MRAVRAVLLAAILVALVPWGGPSSAAESASAATGNFTNDILRFDWTGNVDRRVESSGIEEVTTTSDGALTLKAVGFVGQRVLAPPTGQRFVNGATYELASARSTTHGVVLNVCLDDAHPVEPQSGTLTVEDVLYDGDTITRLAVKWDVHCTDALRRMTAQGFLRLESDAPHPLVAPAPVYAPEAGRSKPVDASLTFANLGDEATTTLGDAAIDPAIDGSEHFAIKSDGCTGKHLEPAAACTVVLTFEMAEAGHAYGRVNVPAPGYPGGRVSSAVSGRVVTAPTTATTAAAFPALNGIGIRWFEHYLASWYRVERRLPSEAWQDVSGPLAKEARTWVDRSISAGASADYRVVAGNADGAAPPSAEVAATRPATDLVLGSVDLLSLDADPGAATTPLVDQVAGPIAVSSPYDTPYRSLEVGDLIVRVPRLLPGPGSYDVGQGSSQVFGIDQARQGCPVDGVLRVNSLAYTDDLSSIATMSASYDVVCRPATGAAHRVLGEIRVKSTQGVAAVAISSVDAGLIRVGQTSDTKTVTIRNIGTSNVGLDKPAISGDSREDWTVASDRCPASLSSGDSCEVSLVVAPTASGSRTALLGVGDSTSRGVHHARLSAIGTSTPDAPANVRAVSTLTGVDLSWDLPANDGSLEITDFTVHRYVGGQETTYAVPRLSGQTRFRWNEPNIPAGATYAVSAQNELGDGATSATQAPSRTRDVVTQIIAGVIHQWAMPDGTQAVPFTPSTPSQGGITDVASSPDGRYLAYADADGLWTVRADSSGPVTPVKVVGTSGIRSVAWSPDRTRLAFAHDENGRVCVSVVAASGGDAVQVRCGVDHPTWLPDARTLVVASEGPLQRVEAKANGRLLGFYLTTEGAVDPQVSPDGRFIAYRASSQTIAIVPINGGEPNPTHMLAAIDGIAWDLSGSRLLYTFAPGEPGDVVGVLPVTESGSLGFQSALIREPQNRSIRSAVWQGLGMAIEPTNAILGPSVRIPFDTSTLPAGTTITCQLDTGLPTACTSPYTRTGMTTGSHTLRVKAIEPDGRTVVAARSFTVDATAPAPRITAPIFGATTAASATVSYAATDSSGVASYDVRYRAASASGNYGSYVYPRMSTKGTNHTLNLTPGYEYCVSVRARDVFGTTSGWTAERCFSRPLDDRAMIASAGWTRATSSGFYFSTSTYSTKYGVELSRTVQAKRAYLLATRCPSCGTVAVYLGTRYITAINLYAATTQRQVLISLPVQTSLFSGALRVSSRSTGKLIQIDGLAVRRT
ncbi:choice-of-anchor D domain-containing protein [Pseudonocardia sp.]|uniref:choice-of-anchor D domain-containing protein n=1 Tax=Pseudonocardia sp. TaxID=60912 RepID=UPI0031FC7858